MTGCIQTRPLCARWPGQNAACKQKAKFVVCPKNANVVLILNPVYITCCVLRCKVLVRVTTTGQGHQLCRWRTISGNDNKGRKFRTVSRFFFFFSFRTNVILLLYNNFDIFCWNSAAMQERRKDFMKKARSFIKVKIRRRTSKLPKNACKSGSFLMSDEP